MWWGVELPSLGFDRTEEWVVDAPFQRWIDTADGDSTRLGNVGKT
jgi:hypothetical protein